MNSFYYICAFLLFCGIGAEVRAAVQIRATNHTQVPSAHYIVDAVECLKESYEIYDNDQARAELFVELFDEKHPGKWDVLVGYTAFYGNPDVYIEMLIVPTKSVKKDSDDKKNVYFLIFSGDASNVTRVF